MNGNIAQSPLPESARTKLPTGDAFAAKLTEVSHMIAATALLEAADERERGGGAILVTLPQFGFTYLDGKRYVNRVTWQEATGRATIADGASVRVIALGEVTEIQWRVQDSSAGDVTGTATISPEGVLGGEFPEVVPGIEAAAVPVFSRQTLVRRLERIEATGRGALVELVRLLTPYTTFAVRSAGTRVYREISDSLDSRSVIDELEAETITDRLLYGEDGAASSVVTRLIRRVAATGAVVRKSLHRFIALAIWSAAETNVRSHIGDPHAGRSIRRTARVICSTDPEKVLSAYRETYPNSDVGLARVVSALTAGATVAAQQVALDWAETNDRGER